jgi:hypothetical protein
MPLDPCWDLALLRCFLITLTLRKLTPSEAVVAGMANKTHAPCLPLKTKEDIKTKATVTSEVMRDWFVRISDSKKVVRTTCIVETLLLLVATVLGFSYC